MIDLTRAADNLMTVFGLDLDPRVAAAAARMPRDGFVSRVFDDRRAQWVTNNDSARWRELLEEDRFVPIRTDEANTVTSSISQPSLVFAMIQKLGLKPGDRVLEIGAASGWSAALMADLIGDGGEVVSVEIDPDLVTMARQNIAANRISNVKVVGGDALAATADQAPFDKIVYTVGARDFPASLLDSIVEGGRCVLVHKIDATADILYAGVKTDGRLHLDPVVPVIFVELQGTHEGTDEYVELNLRTAERTQPFWGDVSGYVDLLYRTAGLRFYLRMRSPNYRLVRQGEMTGFGLCGDTGAAVLKGTNVVRGDHRGVDEFNRLLRDWVDLGLPGLTGFRLVVTTPSSPLDTMYRVAGRELVYNYFPLLPVPPESGASPSSAARAAAA